MGFGRPIPLDRFFRLVVLFSGWSFCYFRLPFLVVFRPWVQLTELNLDVEASFRIKLVRARVKLLHYGFAWDHGQSLLEHLKHLIEIDMEVGFFLSLLLQELFELFLLLINLKSVHIVLALVIREKVIIRFAFGVGNA